MAAIVIKIECIDGYNLALRLMDFHTSNSLELVSRCGPGDSEVDLRSEFFDVHQALLCSFSSTFAFFCGFNVIKSIYLLAVIQTIEKAIC
jgi:hypothetical protein